mmetsp:Transcript_10501/g.25444  ORF Transcript_10501/g.25444 Transcript_10501/m.25444 type:complete len:250 (+) Transcript_10501:320-1069(+)
MESVCRLIAIHAKAVHVRCVPDSKNQTPCPRQASARMGTSAGLTKCLSEPDTHTPQKRATGRHQSMHNPPTAKHGTFLRPFIDSLSRQVSHSGLQGPDEIVHGHPQHQLAAPPIDVHELHLSDALLHVHRHCLPGPEGACAAEVVPSEACGHVCVGRLDVLDGRAELSGEFLLVHLFVSVHEHQAGRVDTVLEHHRLDQLVGLGVHLPRKHIAQALAAIGLLISNGDLLERHVVLTQVSRGGRRGALRV